jgi:CBS domain-containing protein
MRTGADMLPADMPALEALERARTGNLRAFLVADEGSVIGVLTRLRLEAELQGNGTDKKLTDLISSLEFPHVHTDHALHVALERMSESHLDLLPVVSRADVHKLEGIVTLRDVLDSYGVGPIGSA